MIQNWGINLQELKYPCLDIVPGRVLHIDGDFIAYYVSHDNNEPLESMQRSAEIQIEDLRSAAGAETVKIHLTGKGSTKGNRHSLAVQKPYQYNRKTDKPQHLEFIRQWLHGQYPSVYTLTLEADDTLTMANFAAKLCNNSNLSVICSKDKDLNQAYGLHLDWDTGELYNVDDWGFGRIKLTENGKLIGCGCKYFWAQMLMGDTADGITGLPRVHPQLMNHYSPTVAIRKAQEVLNDPRQAHKHAKAKAVLAGRKEGKSGPVFAKAVLDDVCTNQEAFARVSELYKLGGPYYHWRTLEEVTWQTAMVSEAQLLWMRRTNNPNDVLTWWRNDKVAY